MSQADVETRIEIAEALRAPIAAREADGERAVEVLRLLARDCVNHPAAWSGGRERTAMFFKRDGLPAEVVLGIDHSHDSALATVASCDSRGVPLAQLCVPLIHAQSHSPDYAATEYASKPISDRPALRVRLAAMRPTRFDATDAKHG